MSKQEFQPLSWECAYYDCNDNKIKAYNVLKYRDDFIKKLKNRCKTKETFSDALKQEMAYSFWSKSEYELIISITENDRIVLTPWCGCRNPEEVAVDVTDRADLDWLGFAKKYIGEQIYKNSAKIDVFSQLDYCWQEFVDYVWNFRFKYQRKRIGE